MGLFDKIKQAFTGEKKDETEEEPIKIDETAEKYEKGLEKTRKSFSEKMNELFSNFRKVDEDFFDQLEEILIGADVGFDITMEITDSLRQEVKLKNAKNQNEVQQVIIEKMVDIYEKTEEEKEIAPQLNQDGMTVILFVGVNGVGKTTTIAKLAHRYVSEGKKVLLAAGDTFRAGAIEQLQVWGERVNAEVVTGREGGDPASVAYDAVRRAKEEKADILLIDTAGRLQNKLNLMKELQANISHTWMFHNLTLTHGSSRPHLAGGGMLSLSCFAFRSPGRV